MVHIHGTGQMLLFHTIYEEAIWILLLTSKLSQGSFKERLLRANYLCISKRTAKTSVREETGTSQLSKLIPFPGDNLGPEHKPLKTLSLYC